MCAFGLVWLGPLVAKTARACARARRPTTNAAHVITNFNAELLLSHHNLPFQGRLDEIAVYDHPLTGAQILSHYPLGTTVN